LEFSDISKSFPGVQALRDVSFRAESGRVLALLGENGAGKSTLLKIIAGDMSADSGTFTLSGQPLMFESPHDAFDAGISVIYQERQMVPAISVMENIFAGSLPQKRRGIVDRAALRREAQSIVEKFGLQIDVRQPVGRLSVAYQQMVEIMKAYRRNSSIIAFDEPSASLTDSEIEVLFRLIGQLKNEGKIVIYVSHRMAEIFRISDDIVVLKDGQLVTTLKTAETNEAEIIRAMVGRDIGDTYANLRRNETYGETILEVKNLVARHVKNVSFRLRRGEIIGLAGLVGAGRTELVRAIFGADKIRSGEIFFEGKKVKFSSPAEAVNAGIVLCPEDRKEQGLVLYRSIRDNVSMPVLSKVRRLIFLDDNQENALADEAIERYSIKTPSARKTVIELSGGNQQKVILGRWTSSKMATKVLILDEPTKGIDVGTKSEVYQMVCDFAAEGIAVIFISSELTEVINVADTIYVMNGGRITGSLERKDATEEGVLRLAMLTGGVHADG